MATSRFLLISVALLTLSSTSFAEAIELRPNDPVYVKMGEKVYLEQCASCHGVNLEGQMGWQDTMVDGMRLAPPTTSLAILGTTLMKCSSTSPSMALRQ